MPTKKPQNKVLENDSFEETLNQLEALVANMEKGELSLEDSLKSFEQGIALTRSCQKALKEAEQKVEILSANTLDAPTEPFSGTR